MHSADLRACEEVLRQGSKSFFAASRLLPPRVRGSIAAVYAFCRVSDDAVDEGRSDGAIARLAERLERVYAGAPLDSPIDRALAQVVVAHAIPRAIPEALLEGFRWDLEGRRYETLAELRAYAARVAATVGVMCTLVFGERRPEVLARACDLGVAMQLTNIARDVGEDACRGRIYLPLGWMRAARIDPERWLAAPAPSEEVAALVDRLLVAASLLYARADDGIAQLPWDCRVAIRAARLIYADLERPMRRARFDSVTRRAATGRARKLWLLMRSLPALAPQRVKGAALPALPEVRFLLDAVTAASGP